MKFFIYYFVISNNIHIQHMEPENIEKQLHVKKSSFELEQNDEGNFDQGTQNGESNQFNQQTTQKERNFNLLDLDQENEGFNKEQYSDFLKDRIITIEGPQLITQNVIKSYKLYKIKSRKKDQNSYDTCISRRFSDFQYLQEKLIEKYGGCIIPLLPPKNLWANVNWQGEEFVKQRTKNLEYYLKNLISHPKLRMTDQIRNFLFFDEIKFSEGKGDFFSKIKTEDKVKNIASNAYNFGLGIYSKYIQGKKNQEDEYPKISKPSLEDLKLLEYQRDVDGLVKVINVLQEMVENSVEQMQIITNLESQYKESHDSKLKYEHIKLQFEEVSQYIKSCSEALQRRTYVRLETEQLSMELENLQKKVKNNPRSQQIDIIRNKLAKATERCEKWTDELLNELEQSVTVGKSMVEDFINSYVSEKHKFYNL